MTSFNETWAPTWEVEKTIQGARACLLENTGRTFKTGRAIVDAVFYDGNRREIERRTGMTLTSKAGKEYTVTVCKREREREPEPRLLDSGDVFEDAF
jgi:hypothetical protein